MRPFRRFIIVIAELMQVFSLLLWTAGGIWGGSRAARIVLDSGYLRDFLTADNAPVVGAVVGGLAGLVISATAAAIVFSFAQIEVNTREVARYYMERRKSEAMINRAINSKP